MVTTFKNKTYLLGEFINLVKDKQERAAYYAPSYNYALYAVEAEVTSDLEVYVGNPVEVKDYDEEIFPEYVVEHAMWYFCSDENIQDVVDLAVSRSKNVTVEQLISALDYYLEHDDFMDVC
ncbi:hypothetical protein GJV77_13630 [Myroides pelagicus]|uniref:DUF7716 domain-containing protein n=1 Tax=Myroides pelagicus TaxID=270914 RepID=A0A7K1GQ67_9FLAO|nr:hypothetical protein [Myroides pelagicus]